MIASKEAREGNGRIIWGLRGIVAIFGVIVLNNLYNWYVLA